MNDQVLQASSRHQQLAERRDDSFAVEVYERKRAAQQEFSGVDTVVFQIWAYRRFRREAGQALVLDILPDQVFLQEPKHKPGVFIRATRVKRLADDRFLLVFPNEGSLGKFKRVWVYFVAQDGLENAPHKFLAQFKHSVVFP